MAVLEVNIASPFYWTAGSRLTSLAWVALDKRSPFGLPASGLQPAGAASS